MDLRSADHGRILTEGKQRGGATEQAELARYANMAHAKYEDSLFTAHKLQKAVDKLIAKPSESRLKKTRVAWKAAWLPYHWSWRSR